MDDENIIDFSSAKRIHKELWSIAEQKAARKVELALRELKDIQGSENFSFERIDIHYVDKNQLEVICDYSTIDERIILRTLRDIKKTILAETGVDLDIVPKCIHGIKLSDIP